ncbi:hypothetical protein ACPA9J_01035 [Pseudomonas aeruginosa]
MRPRLRRQRQQRGTHRDYAVPAMKKTACILCSLNCGLEVQTENGRISKIRGDDDHPASQGYVCEKSQRMDYYQNGADRLDTPMRRRPVWQLRSHRLEHGDPRGGGEIPRHQAQAWRRKHPLLRRRRGATTSAAPTATAR